MLQAHLPSFYFVPSLFNPKTDQSFVLKHASQINAKRKCQFKKEPHKHKVQKKNFTLSYILNVAYKPSLIFLNINLKRAYV